MSFFLGGGLGSKECCFDSIENVVVVVVFFFKKKKSLLPWLRVKCVQCWVKLSICMSMVAGRRVVGLDRWLVDDFDFFLCLACKSIAQ